MTFRFKQVAGVICVALAALSLGACSTYDSFRFRLFVVDAKGNVLGSGVWEWRQWVGDMPKFDYELLGDAIAFKFSNGKQGFALPVGGGIDLPQSASAMGGGSFPATSTRAWLAQVASAPGSRRPEPAERELRSDATIGHFS